MKKVIFIAILLISFIVINNLFHSIYDLWKKKDSLSAVQKELVFEKQKNKKLKTELSIVGSQDFIEKEARNKLFLVKPGEQEVLIEEKIDKKSSLAREEDSNWKKWWSLFF